MATGVPLPQVPPTTTDPKDLAGPTWQRWFSLIATSIKSLITANQTNQFGNGANGAGCYSTPARAAATDYTTGESPRFVSVILTVDTAGEGGYLTVGGSIVSHVIVGTAGVGYITLCAIVPANTTYRLTIAGLSTLASWLEL